MRQVSAKICGVKSVEEAKILAAAVPDYVGLNFVPVSTRVISIKTAELILKEISGIETVALFADQPLELVNQYAMQLNIDYVQLHGNESADYVRQLDTQVIKSIALGPASTFEAVMSYINGFPADYFVL